MELPYFIQVGVQQTDCPEDQNQIEEQKMPCLPGV